MARTWDRYDGTIAAGVLFVVVGFLLWEIFAGVIALGAALVVAGIVGDPDGPFS